MKKVSILLFVFFMMSHLGVMAQQNVNMKFGKPTKEELEMTSYSLDPQANAVVLCRLTNVEYTVQTNGYLVDYHEKVRIKVLKPEGAEKANVAVPYIHNYNGKSNIKGSKFSSRGNSLDIENPAGSFLEDAIGNYNTESVEDIKAVAYNLVNGKTVKSPMKRDAIKTRKLTTKMEWCCSPYPMCVREPSSNMNILFTANCSSSCAIGLPSAKSPSHMLVSMWRFPATSSSMSRSTASNGWCVPVCREP